MFSSILILCLLGITLGEDWDYEKQDEWPGLCKTGKKQSPIHIITSKVAKFPLNEIEYVDYDKAYDFTVTNNGHTVAVSLAPKSKERPIIRGPLLGSDYIFSALLFHWSAEHVIDNVKYDLEAHFVHYNSKYENISEALKHKKGIAMVTVLYEISRRGNKNFDKLVKGVSEVREVSATSEIRDFALSSIFPSDYKPYYTYMGSATYPNCEENILWIIIKNQATVSGKHVDQFTKIKDPKGNELKTNARKVQELNSRGVFVYDPK